MTIEKDKYIESVAKLIKLTQENKIEWKSIKGDELIKKLPDYKIESAFITTYKTKKLRLFRYHYKIDLSDPTVAFTYSRFWIKEGKKEKWFTSTKLEVIDSSGNTLWEFPDVSPLSDLYSSVQYQVAGINELIDDLLNE